MKALFTVLLLLLLLYGCANSGPVEKVVINTSDFLHGIAPFSSDSLVHVVIEIPAGANQKWEVNKASGQIEWEQVNPDSFRVINYLPYPANYGFVPQTLLPEAFGGDGDPVDVFVLGASLDRERIVKVRMVGIIHMLDKGESDSKLLAVNTDEPGWDVHSLEMLNHTYPGVIDIIKLWLLNYKGSGEVDMLSVKDETEALNYVNSAHSTYLQMNTQ